MKLKKIITCLTLILSSQSFAETYVYCGLPDGSDWEWLLDENNNYVPIEGQWGRITAANHGYFKVFKVQESTFIEKTLTCPEGYITQPAERNSSKWEIFELIRPDGSSYFIDAHKSYYNYQNGLWNFDRM
ncbi:hypothetical protein HQQ94_02950 [Shewanella sp. VB17]|uniref:hypothetical protein n=1 Tax=Shewanella sp. VB17 TaxID=2739432 RepID=UPI00156553F1|nr:hypothetical protein [Shewanella sp. VB17]NRD72211.1 hypothetical protein [Shewanella sp. VB17]